MIQHIRYYCSHVNRATGVKEIAYLVEELWGDIPHDLDARVIGIVLNDESIKKLSSNLPRKQTKVHYLKVTAFPLLE